MNDFYDKITVGETEHANEGFEYRDEDGTSIFGILFFSFSLQMHEIRYPSRYPRHFKHNERVVRLERLAEKITNMKENVVKRIKLLSQKCERKIGRERTLKALEMPNKGGNSLAFVVCQEFMGDDALSDESQEILKNLLREQSLCQCENFDCSKPKVKHAVCFCAFDSTSYFKAENKNMVPFNCLDVRLFGNMYDFFYHEKSMVFKTKWNGQDVVMKCRRVVSNYYKPLNEARHQIKILSEALSTAGSNNENTDNVLAPLAYFEQQYLDYEANDIELDEKFKQSPSSYQENKRNFRSSSKVLNIDVLVYPLFDGNLRQLKILKKDKLTAEELREGLVKI